MQRVLWCAGAALAMGCTSSAAARDAESSAPSPLEGVYEYIGDAKGQSMMVGGRFSFISGPRDGSGPTIADAGTYEISGDTATHVIRFATDPKEVGTTFRWRPERWAGDTLTYVVIGKAGEVLSRGSAVKIR